MKTRTPFRYLGCIVAALALLTLRAEDPPFLDRLLEEDQEAVRAVVMYPEHVRTQIFLASTYPGALVRMDRLRDQSQVAFQQMLKPLDEETGKKLWELARYPELVAVLGGEERPADEALAAALAEHPDAIHPVVEEFSKRNKRKHVQALETLNRKTTEAFDQLLSRYPERTRRSLRALLDYPEVLDILTGHIDLTAELGDIYRMNPKGVETKATELQLRMVREIADADRSWSESVGGDPEAMAELAASAADYAEQNPRPEYVYVQPPPEPTQVVVRVYAYPYWYGYPHWWGDPFWYPRPLWYHSGFYVSSSGTVVIVGAPSYHYTHWHFHTHHAHGHYVHLSGHYGRHYERHRHHDHGVAGAMRDRERDNGKQAQGWAVARGEERGEQRGDKRGPRADGFRDGSKASKVRNRPDRSVRTLDGKAAGRGRARAGEFHQRQWGGRSAGTRGGGRGGARGGSRGGRRR